MSARALLISLFLHSGILGAIYYFSVYSEPQQTGDGDFVVEAPLGNVFVKEEGFAEQKPLEGTENKKPDEPVSGEMTFPTEEKQTALPTFAAGQPGVPDGEATPIGEIKPGYPAASRRFGEQGESSFLLEIDAAGSVLSATLEQSSGHERLDAAAKEALLAARFSPAMLGGVGAASMKRFRIEFRLDKSN